MTTQHTPGPWEHEARKTRSLPLGKDAAYGIWRGGVLVADVSGRPRAKQAEEEANARLIAASPELIDALERLLDQADERYPHFESARGTENRNCARVAIAKANRRCIVIGDVTKTRLFFQDGHILEYDSPKLAYSVWLSFPKGTKVAFRSAGDATPVYSHDYVDRKE